MLENNNQNEVIVSNSELKENYYTSTGKKVGDFFLGFFGVLILNFILAFIFGFLFIFANLYWMNLFISIAISLALIFLFFKKNRRFIAIGIIAMMLIPILVFGSCLVLLGGMSLG